MKGRTIKSSKETIWSEIGTGINNECVLVFKIAEIKGDN